MLKWAKRGPTPCVQIVANHLFSVAANVAGVHIAPYASYYKGQLLYSRTVQELYPVTAGTVFHVLNHRLRILI